MTNEEKKELQKSRMKTYFIESTKELIKEVGIENITTKKIGDRAGYSYATIYNYFENFNELICICIKDGFMSISWTQFFSFFTNIFSQIL